MPVWHEFTREWRENGDLTVVGIVQEQHAERARLYAQWQGLDWPILWDPLNLTGSMVVPNVWAIDEFGIVRSDSPSRKSLERDFVRATFANPGEVPKSALPVQRMQGKDPNADPRQRAYAQILWGRPDGLTPAIQALSDPQNTVDQFRLGVALRLRYDSPEAQPGDFGAAVDAWSQALTAQPEQYIWRRRLQQFGPRLDKPYPFYSWVAQARTDLLAKNVEPLPLKVRLTESERLDPRSQRTDLTAATSPDPDARIPDGSAKVQVSTVLVAHTTKGQRSYRVHLDLRPREGVKWNNEGDATQLWADLPDAWKPTQRLFEAPVPPSSTSNELRQFDFEITPLEEAKSFAGYVLFDVCEQRRGRPL